MHFRMFVRQPFPPANRKPPPLSPMCAGYMRFRSFYPGEEPATNKGHRFPAPPALSESAATPPARQTF